jgi:transposase
MPRSRPPYPQEFRQRIIELVRKGRTPESLAEQFEPSAQTIRNWLAQAERDAGQRPDGLTTDEREEMRRVRRENKTLREEREIPVFDFIEGWYNPHRRHSGLDYLSPIRDEQRHPVVA